MSTHSGTPQSDWPRATKSTQKTSSPFPNWPLPTSGCAIMSPWP